MNHMLDNAAACKPYSWAADLFAEKCLELFANQESSGKLGVESEKAVKTAEEQIASALAPGYGVFFCNTGTDALRAAVCAVLCGKQNAVSLSTKAEHPALLKRLQQGSKVFYCSLARDGGIRNFPETEADLFAVHHVNSETGRILDPGMLRNRLPEKTVFLLDTIQSVCKIPIPGNIPDFLTVSGCKIGAPCGAALLYRKTFEKQIKQIRREEHLTGRCVPAAACVLGEVVVHGISELKRRYSHAEKLNKLLRDILSGEMIDFTVSPEEGSPYILHMLLPGFEGGILVRMLQEKGITAASGSACSSEVPEPSAVLRAMGYTAKEAYSALRISFFDDTTEEEVLFFANTLKTLLKNY